MRLAITCALCVLSTVCQAGTIQFAAEYTATFDVVTPEHSRIGILAGDGGIIIPDAGPLDYLHYRIGVPEFGTREREEWQRVRETITNGEIDLVRFVYNGQFVDITEREWAGDPSAIDFNRSRIGSFWVTRLDYLPNNQVAIRYALARHIPEPAWLSVLFAVLPLRRLGVNHV